MDRKQFQVRVPKRAQAKVKDLNTMLAAYKIKYGKPSAFEAIFEAIEIRLAEK
jgi:hypothetical protein